MQVLDTLRATVAPRSGALSPEAEALLCSASYLLQQVRWYRLGEGMRCRDALLRRSAGARPLVQAPVGVLSSGEARYAEGTSAAARQAARPWRYRDPASGSSELCFFGVQLRSSAVPSAEQLQNVRTLLFA